MHNIKEQRERIKRNGRHYLHRLQVLRASVAVFKAQLLEALKVEDEEILDKDSGSYLFIAELNATLSKLDLLKDQLQDLIKEVEGVDFGCLQ